jgi:4'-phosphopantetheinyl transferase
VVDVWLVSLVGDPPIAIQNDEENILSPDEIVRAARFRFEPDRARWIRARSALRTILAGFAGTPAAEVRFVLGRHGKPALADGSGVEFSLSHSGDWAMIAVTRSVPVGIDIERIRKNVDIAALLGRLGEKNLPEGQTALFTTWTRREAMTKALGGALMKPPSGDIRTLSLAAPDGYCASLATIGHDPHVTRQICPFAGRLLH